MTPALKILSIIAFAATFALASLASVGFVKNSVVPWLGRRKERIEKGADEIGLDLSPSLCAVLSPILPVVLMAFCIMRKRRFFRIDSQLPDALALLGNALKSGLSLSQAIETASIETPKPLGAELGRVVAQLKLGRTVEEALAILARRVPTDDVGLIVQSVEVLRRTGGNLIETFGTLAATIEGRRRVEDRIHVLTAQGIYQGILLLIMPWVLGAMLYLVAPDYLDPLLNTRLGAVLIALGIILELAGGLWLKRIVMIRV